MTMGHYMRILGFDVIMNAWMEDVSDRIFSFSACLE